MPHSRACAGHADEQINQIWSTQGDTVYRPSLVYEITLAPVDPETPAAQPPRVASLGALAGGGLFKTVQAPFTPGSQTWSVLLVHPRGIISASKRVRVVSERAALTP